MAQKLPTPGELKSPETKPASAIFGADATKFPSVQVIGCGGCGINIVKKFLQAGMKFDENVKHRIIDTSQSNLSGLSIDTVFDAIGDLGSGKDRAKNYEAITKYIDTHPELFKECADINIICFSMAGGSGSVIAPLLAHRILRNSSNAVIMVGVVDTSSERDCLNSINTLKSLSNMAEKHKHYIPLMLYSNIGIGRIPVNKTIVQRINEIIDMLTSRAIEEIDFSDKMNYLRPTNMNCPSGVYLLSVSATTPENGEDLPGEDTSTMSAGDSVHASFVVNDTGLNPNILTSFSYNGISEEKVFFSTIGKTISKDIYDVLNEVRERYEETDQKKDQTSVKLGETEEAQNSGMIL